MRWLKKTCISGNGNYYLVSNDYPESSQVTLYFVPHQTVMWDKNIGLQNIDNVQISKTGEHILLSTFDYPEYNITYSYLNSDGEILWEKKINKGYSWDRDFIRLDEDGMSFEVFDLSQGDWKSYENTGDTVTLQE